MESYDSLWQGVSADPVTIPDDASASSTEVADAWAAIAAPSSETPAPSAGPTAASSLFAEASADPKPKKRGRPKRSAPSSEAALPQALAASSAARPEVAARLADSSSSAAPALTGLSAPFALQMVSPQRRPCKRGRLSPPTELQQAIAAALAAFDAGGTTLDTTVQKLADHFLDPANFHVTSGVVLQAKFGLSAASLASRLQRLAATLWIQQIRERHLLEERLSQTLPPACLVCYIDASAYDETPMRLSLQDPAPTVVGHNPLMAESIATALAKELMPKSSKRQSLIAKLLQTRGSFGMVLKFAGRVVALMGASVGPLQSMQKTTASVLQHCLESNCAVSHHADSWQVKLRAVCCDKAGYNKKAEEQLAAERGARWQTCLLSCEIHALANTHVRVFEGLAPQHIKGMLRWALSLRLQTTWSVFKQALQTVVRSMPLRVFLGRPPPDVQAHQKELVSLLLGPGDRALPYLVKLLTAVNGDWRRTDTLEHYWNPRWGPTPSASDIKSMMTSALLTTVTGNKPHLWPRHRWTGFREAVADVCMLAAVHGLLHPVYQCFLSMMQKVPHTIAAGEAAGSTQHEGPEAAASGEPLLEEQTDPALGGDHHHVFGDEGTDYINPAVRNAKDRALAWEWVQLQPLGTLTMIALSLQPLERLQAQYFKHAGVEWELEQRARVAEALNGGAASRRLYRLQVAAELQLEREFLESLKAIWKSREKWSLLPTRNWTVRDRACAFRMLSMLGACIHKLLVLPHQTFPFQLFRLLHEPELGPTLAAQPDCCKDEWTRSLEARHKGLEGEELDAALRLQALLQPLDISSIETRHASIRRQVEVKSVHTWRASHVRVSTEWMLQNFRTSRRPLHGRRFPRAVRRKLSKARRSHPCRLWGLVDTSLRVTQPLALPKGLANFFAIAEHPCTFRARGRQGGRVIRRGLVQSSACTHHMSGWTIAEAAQKETCRRRLSSTRADPNSGFERTT